MTDKLDIDGNSRRFQVVVLCVAACVILTSVMVVGALAMNDSISGVSIGERESPDGLLFGSENETAQDPGHEDAGDGDGVGGDTTPSDSDANEGSDLHDMFDANDGDTTVPTVSGKTPRSDQFSTESLTSFVEETHFTTDSDGSDTPRFWRTATRDTYTGTGFTHRDAGNTSLFTPIEADGTDRSSDASDSTTDIIQLHENASRIPIPHGDLQAVSIRSGANPDAFTFTYAGDEAVVVTDSNGNITQLPEGTELEIRTRDTGSSGDGSGTLVELTRYTESTHSDSSIVAETAHSVVTAENAETNTEKADAITTWVKQEHDYVVDTQYSESDDAVERFLTSDEGGQAEHFAATTTALLRQEDVPARVATGYKQSGVDTDGESNDRVGAMEQHAWVEVHTDDGWVVYDPTPDDHERLHDDVKTGDESAVDRGVHEDIIDAWQNNDDAVVVESEPEPDQSQDNGDSSDLQPPYDITVSPDPTPGGTVTVTVEKNGTAVPGVRVLFNDEFVGVTNPDGDVTAQVPYTDSLTVTTRVVDGSESVTAPQFSGASSLGHASWGAGGSDSTWNAGSMTESDGETYELPTNITVGSDDVFFPGEETSATITVDGVALPNVAVYVDGEYVGETDSNGEVTFTVPETASVGDTVRVSVERDAFSSTETVRVSELSVVIDAGLVALPGTNADISVVASTGDRERVLENQSVTVVDGNGDAVFEAETVTIENESVTMTLPFSNTVTATTVVGGAKATTTLSGVLYRAGGVVLGVLIVAGVVGVRVKQRGVPTDSVRARVETLLFSIANALHRGFARFYGICTAFWRSVKRVAYRIRHRVQSWRGASIRFSITGVFGSLREWGRGFIARVKRVFSQSFLNRSVNQNPPEYTTDSVSEQARSLSAIERVRGCWKWVVRQVIGRSGKTTDTTVEIEEKAVASGLPSDPVSRVRKTFQRVQYGFNDADSEVDAAESATDELRESGKSGESVE